MLVLKGWNHWRLVFRALKAATIKVKGTTAGCYYSRSPELPFRKRAPVRAEAFEPSEQQRSLENALGVRFELGFLGLEAEELHLVELMQPNRDLLAPSSPECGEKAASVAVEVKPSLASIESVLACLKRAQPLLEYELLEREAGVIDLI